MTATTTAMAAKTANADIVTSRSNSSNTSSNSSSNNNRNSSDNKSGSRTKTRRIEALAAHAAEKARSDDSTYTRELDRSEHDTYRKAAKHGLNIELIQQNHPSVARAYGRFVLRPARSDHDNAHAVDHAAFWLRYHVRCHEPFLRQRYSRLSSSQIKQLCKDAGIYDALKNRQSSRTPSGSSAVSKTASRRNLEQHRQSSSRSVSSDVSSASTASSASDVSAVSSPSRHESSSSSLNLSDDIKDTVQTVQTISTTGDIIVSPRTGKSKRSIKAANKTILTLTNLDDSMRRSSRQITSAAVFNPYKVKDGSDDEQLDSEILSDTEDRQNRRERLRRRSSSKRMRKNSSCKSLCRSESSKSLRGRSSSSRSFRRTVSLRDIAYDSDTGTRNSSSSNNSSNSNSSDTEPIPKSNADTDTGAKTAHDRPSGSGKNKSLRHGTDIAPTIATQQVVTVSAPVKSQKKKKSGTKQRSQQSQSPTRSATAVERPSSHKRLSSGGKKKKKGDMNSAKRSHSETKNRSKHRSSSAASPETQSQHKRNGAATEANQKTETRQVTSTQSFTDHDHEQAQSDRVAALRQKRAEELRLARMGRSNSAETAPASTSSVQQNYEELRRRKQKELESAITSKKIDPDQLGKEEARKQQERIEQLRRKGEEDTKRVKEMRMQLNMDKTQIGAEEARKQKQRVERLKQKGAEDTKAAKLSKKAKAALEQSEAAKRKAELEQENQRIQKAKREAAAAARKHKKNSSSSSSSYSSKSDTQLVSPRSKKKKKAAVSKQSGRNTVDDVAATDIVLHSLSHQGTIEYLQVIAQTVNESDITDDLAVTVGSIRQRLDSRRFLLFDGGSYRAATERECTENIEAECRNCIQARGQTHIEDQKSESCHPSLKQNQQHQASAECMEPLLTGTSDTTKGSLVEGTTPSEEANATQSVLDDDVSASAAVEASGCFVQPICDAGIQSDGHDQLTSTSIECTETIGTLQPKAGEDAQILVPRHVELSTESVKDVAMNGIDRDQADERPERVTDDSESNHGENNGGDDSIELQAKGTEQSNDHASIVSEHEMTTQIDSEEAPMSTVAPSEQIIVQTSCRSNGSMEQTLAEEVSQSSECDLAAEIIPNNTPQEISEEAIEQTTEGITDELHETAKDGLSPHGERQRPEETDEATEISSLARCLADTNAGEVLVNTQDRMRPSDTCVRQSEAGAETYTAEGLDEIDDNRTDISCCRPAEDVLLNKLDAASGVDDRPTIPSQENVEIPHVPSRRVDGKRDDDDDDDSSIGSDLDEAFLRENDDDDDDAEGFTTEEDTLGDGTASDHNESISSLQSYVDEDEARQKAQQVLAMLKASNERVARKNSIQRAQSMKFSFSASNAAAPVSDTSSSAAGNSPKRPSFLKSFSARNLGADTTQPGFMKSFSSRNLMSDPPSSRNLMKSLSSRNVTSEASTADKDSLANSAGSGKPDASSMVFSPSLSRKERLQLEKQWQMERLKKTFRDLDLGLEDVVEAQKETQELLIRETVGQLGPSDNDSTGMANWFGPLRLSSVGQQRKSQRPLPPTVEIIEEGSETNDDHADDGSLSESVDRDGKGPLFSSFRSLGFSDKKNSVGKDIEALPHFDPEASKEFDGDDLDFESKSASLEGLKEVDAIGLEGIEIMKEPRFRLPSLSFRHGVRKSTAGDSDSTSIMSSGNSVDHTNCDCDGRSNDGSDVTPKAGIMQRMFRRRQQQQQQHASQSRPSLSEDLSLASKDDDDDDNNNNTNYDNGGESVDASSDSYDGKSSPFKMSEQANNVLWRMRGLLAKPKTTQTPASVSIPRIAENEELCS